MKKLLSISIILLSFVCYSQDVFYVSPTGDDAAAGTIDAPWKTWGKAFNSTDVGPGDTVYFRDGVYYKDIDTESSSNFLGFGYRLTRDGTAGNYIHYFAYPGETPILDCGLLQTSDLTEADNNYGIRSLAINYIKFRGLTVRNVWQGQGASGYENSSTGWGFYGSHIEFDNCTVYNVHGSGFHVDATNQDSIYFTNCDAYYCVDSLTYSAPGNDGTGFGVGVNNTESDTSDYVVFTGCRAWYCGDQGFSAAPKGKVEINSCWSFHNGILEGAGWGFKYGWTLNTLTDGMINTSIHNSIAAYNKSSGFNTNDPGALPLHTNIYNNTSYYNGYVGGSNPSYPGYGFYIFNTIGSDAQELLRVYKNNIAYANSDGTVMLASGSLFTHEYNSWNTPPGVTLSDADFISVDSTGITAARQTDGSLPDNNCYNYFLKLAAGSDLIDAGTDVDLPFGGNAPDLGAFEYELDETATDILTFTLADQTGAATINATLHTVSIEVAYTADITDLSPTITLSYGATVIPASGVARDFTNPLPYTVTAEDGVTHQEWTVTVTQEAEPVTPVPTGGAIVKFNGKIVKR